MPVDPRHLPAAAGLRSDSDSDGLAEQIQIASFSLMENWQTDERMIKDFRVVLVWQSRVVPCRRKDHLHP